MNKTKALKELKGSNHCFFYEKEAKEIASAFELNPKLVEVQDTRSEFKGLTLQGINPKTKKEFVEGDTMLGIASHTLAEQICRELKVDYKAMFGKGSQLRECCEQLESCIKE